MLLISLNVALFEKNNTLLKDFFGSHQADILCLQEVTRGVDESVKPEFISKNTIDQATPELSHAFFAPLWLVQNFDRHNFHDNFHFTIDYGGFLEFGNYVKTRFPITQASHVFVQNHFSRVTDWSKWPEEDNRAVQVVDLKIVHKRLRLLNYHGIWTQNKQGNEKTVKACRKINALAQEVDYPVIITGDFNLFPDTPSMDILNQNFRSLVDEYDIATTRPQTNELSHLKRNVVDYVFVSKDVKVNSFAVLEDPVSDHLPLLLDFNL